MTTHTHTHKINSKLVKQTVKKKKYKQEEDLGRIDEQEASGICLPTWSWISICLLFFVFDLGVLGSPPASVKLYQVNMLACKQAERGDPPQFLTVNTSPWFLWAPHVTETKIFSGTKGTSETSLCVCVFSVVSHSLWDTLWDTWIAAHQAPLSMGFFRQEYLNRLPFPPPGVLPNLGIKLMYPVSPALQVHSLPLSHLGNP